MLNRYTENGSRNAWKDWKEETKLSFSFTKVMMMLGRIQNAEIVRTVACGQRCQEMQWLYVQVAVIVRAATKRGSAIRSGQRSNLGGVDS